MSGSLGLVRVQSALKMLKSSPRLPPAIRKPVSKAEADSMFIGDIPSVKLPQLALVDIVAFCDKFLELGRDVYETNKSEELVKIISSTTCFQSITPKDAVILLLLLKRTTSLGEHPKVVSSLVDTITDSQDIESACRAIGFLRKSYPKHTDSLLAMLTPSNLSGISTEAVMHVVCSDPPSCLIPQLSKRWLEISSLQTKPKIIIPATVGFMQYPETPPEISRFFFTWLKSRPQLNHQDRLGAAEIFRCEDSLAPESAAFLVETADFSRTQNLDEFFRILSGVARHLDRPILEKILSRNFRSFGSRYTPAHVEMATDLLKKRKPRRNLSEIV